MLVLINLGSSPAALQYKIGNKAFKRKIPVNAFVGFRNLLTVGQIDNLGSLRSQGVIVYDYQSASFPVNGRGFEMAGAGKNTDLNGGTLEFLFVNDLGKFGAGISFIASSTNAGLSVLNTLVTTGQFPANNIPPLPAIGDNQSIMFWTETLEGDNFGYYVIDYQNKNLVGPVDSGIPLGGDWSVDDLFPLTNSGYFSVLTNASTLDYNLFFNDYSGGTVETYSGNSGHFYSDDIDGRWAYFNDFDNRVFKYFNGEEVFTINYTPENSLENIVGDWNDTSRTNYFYTQTYHSGTTSYSISGISSSGISLIKTYQENLTVSVSPYFNGDFVAITTSNNYFLNELEFYTPQGALLNSVNFLTAGTLYSGEAVFSGMNFSVSGLSSATTFNFVTSGSAEVPPGTIASVDGNDILVLYNNFGGPQDQYHWYAALQANPDFTDLGINIEGYQYTTIENSSFSLVADQEYQFSNYNQFETIFYGDNKFFTIAWNGVNSNIPYTLVNFNGNSQEICVITHDKVNYPTRTIYSNPLSYPRTINENDNFCIALYNAGIYYSGGMDSVTYCDFILYDKDTNSFNTFEFQNSGVDEEKFCGLGGGSISKTFFVPALIDNTNVSILTLTPGDPLISGVTNLGTLEEIGAVFGGVFGDNNFAATYVLEEADDFGTIVVLSGSGEILATQFFSGSSGGVASTGTIYFSTELEGWYAISPFSEFTQIESYDVVSAESDNTYYISDYIYKGNIGLYDTDASTGRIITPSGISSIFQGVDKSYDIELGVGPYSIIIAYLNELNGFVSFKLLDLQGNTVSTIDTEDDEYGVAIIDNQRGLGFSANSGEGTFTMCYLSEGFSGTIFIPSNISGLAPNDFIWWDNVS